MTRLVHPIRTLAAWILTIAALSPAALLAQEELLDEEVVPIKRYTVELVVFSYAEDVAVGTELFPADKLGLPSDEITEIVVTKRLRRHPDAVGLAPVLLSENQFTMYNVVERLQLLDAYDPIMHVGWTQAGFPLKDSEGLDVSVFGEPPDGLEGSFTLYLERYLHLIVDLSMDAPVEVIEIEFDDNTSYELEGAAPLQGPVRYRIMEDRIVKNGEIRYFDHPKFGVIAKVSRINDETGTDASSAALLSRTAQ